MSERLGAAELDGALSELEQRSLTRNARAAFEALRDEVLRARSEERRLESFYWDIERAVDEMRKKES